MEETYIYQLVKKGGVDLCFPNTVSNTQDSDFNSIYI